MVITLKDIDAAIISAQNGGKVFDILLDLRNQLTQDK